LHSLGLAERSVQLARDYARERLQGRNTSGIQRPIIEHADVRRMLLLMKSLTQAARGLAYTAAATLDVAHSAEDATQRAAATRRADLLTPLVKAWCSDVAVEVASLGVQVHGGMGFVDDAEISQVYRDARIGPIFEGTNYIQAQDLVARKVVRDKGAVLGELLAQIESTARGAASAAVSDRAHPLAHLQSGLLDYCARLRQATAELIERSALDPELIGATAYNFLQWLGILAGGWQLALSATRAGAELNANEARAVVELAGFYGAHVLPRASVHEAIVRHGADAVSGAAPTGL
jgi:3-(methylthio)propanoyl-CoA dehydrogenase